jgi:hypothetical protein
MFLVGAAVGDIVADIVGDAVGDAVDGDSVSVAAFASEISVRLIAPKTGAPPKERVTSLNKLTSLGAVHVIG